MAVTLEIEKTLAGPVIGVDEAGRGPLVGGVYAGAVSVPMELAERLIVGGNPRHFCLHDEKDLP